MNFRAKTWRCHECGRTSPNSSDLCYPIKVRAAVIVAFVFTVFVALALFGCGGESFTTAVDVGAGSTVEAGTGGAAPFETGGGSFGGGSGGYAPGSGGMRTASGGARATGGVPSATGGAHSTGGASTGGAATGGSPSTGGVESTGGAPASGGAAVSDACAPVTHDDGAGQHWQDCTPLGTYTAAEAASACNAWCAANGCLGCFQAGCAGVSYVFAQMSSDPSSAMGWGLDGKVSSVNLTQNSCSETGTWR